MTNENQAAYDESNLENSTENPTSDTKSTASCCAGKSRFSPTVKGALIGAVAGSILPVFGTFSGAIIGGIAGKIYEKKCAKH